MAKLVPTEEAEKKGLGDLQGWLEAHDPFLEAVDAIVAARPKQKPRSLRRHASGGR